MEEFVGYIVKNLVDVPEEVTAECRLGEDEVIIDIRVSPTDAGKVIGRRGKTIQALRTIAGMVAARLGCRVRVELASEE